MRIGIVNRYFWPEHMLVNEIAKWLAEEGHSVDVLTGQPDYHPEVRHKSRPRVEVWHKVKIRRIAAFRDSGRGALRNLNSLLFVFLAALRIAFGPKLDVVWCTSIPPVVQPLLLRVASSFRRTKFVFFVQDIYPEIATASGMMKPSRVSTILRKLDNWTLARADVVVTLSADMVKSIHDRGVHPQNLRIIGNFAPVGTTGPKLRDRISLPVRFVFAGNIGRFQNLDALIEAFSLVDENQAVLEMLGNGREKARLVQKVAERGIRSVKFHDHLPVNEAFEFTAACDVGIVSLTPGIYRYAFPSKTYSYLAAGLPLMAIVEKQSELAQTIVQRGIGVAVESTDTPEVIASAIMQFVDGLGEYRRNVLSRTEDLFLPSSARRKWIELFQGLEWKKKAEHRHEPA